MSHQIQLVPELEQLVVDYVSVGQRFTDLATTYLQQKKLLQNQQTELENYVKQLSAIRQTEIEYQRILKSYEQLKIDYDLLHSATGIHREEIRAENNKRVRELEEELEVAKAKTLEQTKSHQIVIDQIVSDYEAKLRKAEAKIRQLNSLRNETSYPKDTETTAKNKRFTQLAVQVKSRLSCNRGRGKARGVVSRKKLFVAESDSPMDILE